MKIVQITELEKQALLSRREPFAIEYNGKLIGYYYPVVVDQKAVEKAAEELEKALEQVMAETGWTEDELVREMTKPL